MGCHLPASGPNILFLCPYGDNDIFYKVKSHSDHSVQIQPQTSDESSLRQRVKRATNFFAGILQRKDSTATVEQEISLTTMQAQM